MHGTARCDEWSSGVRNRPQQARHRCPAATLHVGATDRRDSASGRATLQTVRAEYKTGAIASPATERERATAFLAGGCAIRRGQRLTLAGDTLDSTKPAGTAAAHYLSV